jgi:hypothetical protein
MKKKIIQAVLLGVVSLFMLNALTPAEAGAAKINNIDQMFDDDGSMSGYKSESTIKLAEKICSFMQNGGLRPQAVESGASPRPSEKTPYAMVDYLIKRFKTQPIEEIYADLRCNFTTPILYYAVEVGICGDAYGFFRKLQELRDDGIISQEILKEIILEGPVPIVLRGKEAYNTWELLQVPRPGHAGHNRWCPVLKEEMRKELGL